MLKLTFNFNKIVNFTNHNHILDVSMDKANGNNVKHSVHLASSRLNKIHIVVYAGPRTDMLCLMNRKAVSLAYGSSCIVNFLHHLTSKPK